MLFNSSQGTCVHGHRTVCVRVICMRRRWYWDGWPVHHVCILSKDPSGDNGFVEAGWWRSLYILLELCTVFTSVHLFPVDFWIMHRGLSFVLTGATIHVESIVIKLYSLAHLLKATHSAGRLDINTNDDFLRIFEFMISKNVWNRTRKLARFANIFWLTH